MKLVTLKTVNANQTNLTIENNGTTFTISNFNGVLGTKMKKYFGTQSQIRPVARNRKGHFVSIKGLTDQIMNLISYKPSTPNKEEETMLLTINTVLESYGVDIKKLREGNQTIRVGNTTFLYFYSYDPADNEDFHRFNLNGKDVFFADKSCRHPQRMHEDALRLNKFLSQYHIPAETVPFLTLEGILEGFAFDTDNKRTLMNHFLEFRTGFNRVSGKQGYMLLCNNTKSWYSENLTQESLVLLEKVLIMIFQAAQQTNQPQEAKPMKDTKLKLNTNVSNNQVKAYLTSVGIQPDTVPYAMIILRPMQSKQLALEVILQAVESATVSDSVTSPMAVITDLISRIKESGNYEVAAITEVLRSLWKEYAPLLHSTPLFHATLKSCIVALQEEMKESKKSHMQLKAVQEFCFTHMIEALAQHV